MRSKIVAAGSALLLVAGLVTIGASPALADQPADQVCSPLDSGKTDVVGAHETVTITAPLNQLISGYCVKAGSINQGNGPEYVTVDPPVKTITFGHSSEKDVSHWSASYVAIPRDAAAVLSTTPATCTSGETLVLGAVAYSTWGTPTRTTGPGQYEVTATALSNHLFPDGDFSLTFTGALSGPLTGAQCDEGASVVPAATAVDACGTASDVLTLPTSDQVSYVVDDQRIDGVGTVIVTAYGINGFQIRDGATRSWTFTFTDEPCVVVLEVLADPAMTDVCNTADDGFSVPADSDEVSYLVDDQRIAGVGAVTVTATANAGFRFADNIQTVWDFEFTDLDCPSTVVPTTPGVNGELCFLGDFIAGSINVELSDGVEYRIVGDGVDMVATQAITNVAPGAYTVTAVAKHGYVLDGQSTWQMTVAAAQACGDLETHPLVSPLASMTNLTCDTDGSYTLNAIEGVLWFVDGDPAAAGTYPVMAPGTVHVTAQADGPEYGLEFEAQTAWTFTFTAAEACGDLVTLAMTGAQGTSGLLASSILLLLGGAFLALNRRKGTPVE